MTSPPESPSVPSVPVEGPLTLRPTPGGSYPSKPGRLSSLLLRSTHSTPPESLQPLRPRVPRRSFLDLRPRTPLDSQKKKPRSQTDRHFSPIVYDGYLRTSITLFYPFKDLTGPHPSSPVRGSRGRERVEVDPVEQNVDLKAHQLGASLAVPETLTSGPQDPGVQRRAPCAPSARRRRDEGPRHVVGAVHSRRPPGPVDRAEPPRTTPSRLQDSRF